MRNLNNSLNYIQDRDTKKTIKEILYKASIFLKNNIPFYTDFLSPVEFKYASDLLNSMGIDYTVVDAGTNTERKTLMVGDDNKDVLAVFYIEPIHQTIKHGDVLGALLSLGIKRCKIGDIVFNNDRVEFAVLKDVIYDVKSGLTSIKKSSVRPLLKDTPLLQKTDYEINLKSGSLSSLRLDALLALMLNYSRTKAQRMIKSGKVKLNHEINDSVDSKIEEKDEISVSGIGRFMLDSVGGSSKKGRIYIKYYKKG